jgi:hypothetical protein
LVVAATALDDRQLIPGASLCAVLALIVTTAIAAPVILSPSTRLFGPELVGRHHDPFTVIEQYQAGAVPFPYLQPATDEPGFLLSRLIGPVGAYNVLLLVTFPLAALFAYAHARHVIGSSAGALVAALLFAFSPFHYAHASYHVHLAQIQWVPLAFLALWRLLDRPTPIRGACLAVALLITAASSFYLGFIVAITVPVAAMAAALGGRGRVGASAWIALAVGAVILLVAGIVLVAAPMQRVIAAAAFPLSALQPHSARVWSYVAPTLWHPWFGPSALEFWRSTGIGEGVLEQQVTVGIGVLALAVVPCVAALRASTPMKTAVALLVAAIAAFVVSLPPHIDLAGMHVTMPSRWLYAVAPIFRSYARFAIVVSLALTTLAGAGFAMLVEGRSRLARLCAVGLLAIAVLEYLPPAHAWRETLPTAGHVWLATQSDARVLDCIPPSPGATAGLAMLMHHQVSALVGPFADCAEPTLGDKLAAFHFTHAIVRADDVTWPWTAAGGVPDGTRLRERFEDAAVFEVTAPEPRVYVRDMLGFFPREYLPNASWRWMADRGALTVISRRAEPVDVTLDIELASFATPRIADVTVDDGPVTKLKVQPDFEWHAIGPLRLTVGTHTIAFEADATPVSAVTAAARDDRQLSIRVGRWRWKPH